MSGASRKQASVDARMAALRPRPVRLETDLQKEPAMAR
jgi:hypothetical protein